MQDTYHALQSERIQRLQALLDEKFAGNKASLGRALGHGSGAAVRAMLQRERPISEKTVAAIHSLPGCDGWMSARSQPRDSANPAPRFSAKEARPTPPAPTIGHLAKALSTAVEGLSAARLAGIANSVSAMITNGPSDDQAEVIDTLTQGRTLPVQVNYAQHAWRAAAFSLASAASKPEDRELLERFVEAVDQYVAENPPE